MGRNTRDELFNCIRNGIFHDAETRGGWKIRRGPTDEPKSRVLDWPERILYRNNFHLAFSSDFAAYLKKLKEPPEVTLRENFKTRMDAIAGLKTEQDTLYFAYGSNLDRKRLRERIGPPEPIRHGMHALWGWSFEFSKESNDGTAKANIVRHSRGMVWGCVYGLSSEQFLKLGNEEKGYTACDVTVWPGNEKVRTFIDNECHGRALPVKKCYMRRILLGANCQGLPGEYRNRLWNMVRARLERCQTEIRRNQLCRSTQACGTDR